MGLRPLYAGTIHGSAPFIRRVDIRVCALYTQGWYQSLRPSYAGLICGSVPSMHRDTGQGLYIHSGLCPDTQGFGQGWYTYIHITQNIYVCVHMSCLSHARVVPILDAPTVPRVRDQWSCACLWWVYNMTVGCCDLWLDDTGLSPGIDGLCRHDRCDLIPWYSHTCLRLHTADSHIILALMIPSFLVDYLPRLLCFTLHIISYCCPRVASLSGELHTSDCVADPLVGTFIVPSQVRE